MFDTANSRIGFANTPFTNADSNYYSAPQQINDAGDVKGHSHIVIEQLASLNQTDPTDPNKFAFFKGLNNEAQNGILTADVTGGLNPGAYRIASINSAANHQPVLVAIAQRGALDDMVYVSIVVSSWSAETHQRSFAVHGRIDKRSR